MKRDTCYISTLIFTHKNDLKSVKQYLSQSFSYTQGKSLFHLNC